MSHSEESWKIQVTMSVFDAWQSKQAEDNETFGHSQQVTSILRSETDEEVEYEARHLKKKFKKKHRKKKKKWVEKLPGDTFKNDFDFPESTRTK